MGTSRPKWLRRSTAAAERRAPGAAPHRATARRRGEAFASQDTTAHLDGDRSTAVSLSAREREALVLYASGMKIDAVARRMGVKSTTAAEYVKRVRDKYLRAGMPLPTKTDLYRQARAEGLVP